MHSMIQTLHINSFVEYCYLFIPLNQIDSPDNIRNVFNYRNIYIHWFYYYKLTTNLNIFTGYTILH